MSAHAILTGKVEDRLPELEADSFDAMLTDPPYGLEFMGKDWDKAVPPASVWAEAYRVLKPGAFGLVFGGTRTWHRLAVALEDAGFELRDTIMWLYGSGFPKSHDVSKGIDKAAGAKREVVGSYRAATQTGATHGFNGSASNEKGQTTAYITAPSTPEAETWNGYGTSLKPAYEPCLVIRKPSPLTFAQNALEHGCGALNIDGGRIEAPDHPGVHKRLGDVYSPTLKGKEKTRDSGTFHTPAGRWPANVILDPIAGALLDEQTGESVSRQTTGRRPGKAAGRLGSFVGQDSAVMGHNDSGGASRFFYSAKTSKRERNEGLEGDNKHPTLKPIALTQYLATLLLPPDTDRERRILTPYSGAGSEMIGALLAGWDHATGIELSPEYAAIAEARINHWTRQPALFSAAD